MTISLTDVLLMPIERPRCGGCRIPMNLSSIVARADHSERRTFECPKCDFTEISMVSDPLATITQCLRPGKFHGLRH